MDIKKNQLIFYYPYNWSGHITEEFSGKYSHCTVAYSPFITSFCEFEFSSSPIKGITFRKIDWKLNFDVYTIKQKAMEVFNEVNAWKWACERVEWCVKHPVKKIFTYDYIGLIGFLFQNPKLNRPNAYFCSELLDQFGLKGGISFREDLQYWNQGPTDIANSNLIDYSWSNVVKK